MNVSEAVTSRRSIRAFLDQPVDMGALRRVLETAQRAPSGGNVQPWNAVVVTGEPLQRLFAAVADIIAQGRSGHSAEYDIYPAGLDGPYEDRRVGVGEAMYAALGIPRADRQRRLDQFAANFRAFGAPVLMLVHTPRYMGPPQWADMGMWLQTVMLLLREEGLDSCPQEAWAMYSRQIRDCVPMPDENIFFCGMAIGHRDSEHPINNFCVTRSSLSESVRFLEF